MYTSYLAQLLAVSSICLHGALAHPVEDGHILPRQTDAAVTAADTAITAGGTAVTGVDTVSPTDTALLGTETGDTTGGEEKLPVVGGTKKNTIKNNYMKMGGGFEGLKAACSSALSGQAPAITGGAVTGATAAETVAATDTEFEDFGTAVTDGAATVTDGAATVTDGAETVATEPSVTDTALAGAETALLRRNAKQGTGNNFGPGGGPGGFFGGGGALRAGGALPVGGAPPAGVIPDGVITGVDTAVTGTATATDDAFSDFGTLVTDGSVTAAATATPDAVVKRAPWGGQGPGKPSFAMSDFSEADFSALCAKILGSTGTGSKKTLVDDTSLTGEEATVEGETPTEEEASSVTDVATDMATAATAVTGAATDGATAVTGAETAGATETPLQRRRIVW